MCNSLYVVGRIVKALSSDIEKSIHLKHKTLKQTDLPDDLLNTLIKEDKEYMIEIKRSIFTTVALNLPERYIPLVPIYFWDENISFEKVLDKLKEELKDDE